MKNTKKFPQYSNLTKQNSELVQKYELTKNCSRRQKCPHRTPLWHTTINALLVHIKVNLLRKVLLSICSQIQRPPAFSPNPIVIFSTNTNQIGDLASE